MNAINLGRDKLDWGPDVWARIDQAVHDEAQRTKIAVKFLPLYPVGAEVTTIPSDAVDPHSNPLLTVDETDCAPILEIWTEFALTKQQYENEQNLMTAVTLAINAANRLSRAEDLLIFQGDAGIADDLFQSRAVNIRGAKKTGNKIAAPFPITGLLPAEANQQIPIEPTEVASDPTQNRYGENTFGAVARGYSLLQRTHYGRQALVLPATKFADAHAPLRTTLIMPADRIKGLVENRFYGTSSLPDNFEAKVKLPEPVGVLVAIDGNTMDLVVGMDAITEFMQIDGEGLYRFRVFERFALRLKDRRAVVELKFQATGTDVHK